MPAGSGAELHLSEATGASISNTVLTGFKTEDFTTLLAETLEACPLTDFTFHYNNSIN